MVGNPAVPAIDDRNTKCPRPRSSMPGRTYRVSTMGASRFSRVAVRTTAGSMTAAMSVVSIAGVVDQHVDRPEVGLHDRDEGLDGCRVGQVDDHGVAAHLGGHRIRSSSDARAATTTSAPAAA